MKSSSQASLPGDFEEDGFVQLATSPYLEPDGHEGRHRPEEDDLVDFRGLGPQMWIAPDPINGPRSQ